jgi:hypothetical protein
LDFLTIVAYLEVADVVVLDIVIDCLLLEHLEKVVVVHDVEGVPLVCYTEFNYL